MLEGSCPPRQPGAGTYESDLGLYCTASARWAASMLAQPARSAIVLASLSVRWYARAERCNCRIAALTSDCPAASNWQDSRVSALQVAPRTLFVNRDLNILLVALNPGLASAGCSFHS